jgi:flagellar basal-body rod protein FlgB
MEPQTVRGAAESPNGNGVSLEQEMVKSVDARRQHDQALAIYKSALTIMRSTLGRR